jgi:hypothetical protein
LRSNSKVKKVFICVVDRIVELSTKFLHNAYHIGVNYYDFPWQSQTPDLPFSPKTVENQLQFMIKYKAIFKKEISEAIDKKVKSLPLKDFPAHLTSALDSVMSRQICMKDDIERILQEEACLREFVYIKNISF